MFALALVPLVAATGAAVDYSHGNQIRTSLQKALDSAVLAAAIDGSPNWRTAALNSFNGNVNAKDSAVRTPTFTLDKDIYSGSVSALTDTSFMGVVGITSLTDRVLPHLFPTLDPNVFESVLHDAIGIERPPPSGTGDLATDYNTLGDTGTNNYYDAPNCAVQANSRSSKGMTQEGKPTANARKFGVSGGHSGGGFSPPPKDGSAAVADPYASIPFPAYEACDAKVGKGLVIQGGSTTLSPGTYCGGIRIKAGASVTLQPGIYVMVDGSFWLDGGSSATGKEVVIAFTGDDATLRIWGDSTVDLTSPTSGTYKNFQFFQNPNDDKGRGAWVSIGGNGNTGDKSKATWDGMAYFPTQNFWVFGNTVVNINSPAMPLVAGQIWVQGNATLNVTNDNPRNVPVTPITTAGGARLIQ